MQKERLSPLPEDDNMINSYRDLILFNDDVNSFDHVISTLIEVCKHDIRQAEQCALIAHLNGKCSIKSGTYSELRPVAKEMGQRNLTVEIK